MLLAMAVALGDVALHLLTRHPSVVDGAFFGLAVALIVVLRHRSVSAAFVATLVLASFTGGAFVLLLWIAYQAGRGIVTRSGFVVAVGAALGALGGQLAILPRSAAHVVATFLVFVALPMLAGRYVAQHERLLSTLEQNSRLRIARDMHDSLGHRLSLASIQAAALEVSDLPPQHRQAVAQLATSVRAATNELHQMVATLRGSPTVGVVPRVEAIDRLTVDFSAAGVPVALHHAGRPRPLAPEVGEAAYRVAQEGLTNAAKHAPGQPVTMRVSWEPDALLLTLTNPAPSPTLAARPLSAATPPPLAPPSPAPPPPALLPPAAGGPAMGGQVAVVGHGLAGLDERVRQAGGFLDNRVEGGDFRLVAMLPYAHEPVSRARILTVGVAAAVLMFMFLPATMVVGVSP
ncbi:sensor histidine kinase [Allorhizocola rhizosphaerae]|uniref:sensor histidine kinase n=1 Tax=Allorhizocola rhizosphaerae TaxID=1872709 RepID=UPI0013C34497|nr:histidine kinase [Allorhizocola rhizosphaerae]